jgi:hypothetical protein
METADEASVTAPGGDQLGRGVGTKFAHWFEISNHQEQTKYEWWRVRGRLPIRRNQSIGGRTMYRQFALAVAASMLAVLTLPASAETMQVSGIGKFNELCQPPDNRDPPADQGDYLPIELTGDLYGCWYTYISSAKFNRSGTYQETGTETFVGCLNGTCGTFETTYTFTGKFDDTFTEIHGRCHHPIASGTGGFAGAKGVINFKDDVVTPKFDYKGHIELE